MKTREALAHFGNQKKLSEAIDVSRETIRRWGEYPPVPQQYVIQVRSKHVLLAEPEIDRLIEAREAG